MSATDDGGPSRSDLADRADVEVLVTTFYHRVFEDELLGPVFLDVARMDLAAHLPVMCDFRETVLFRTGMYKRNALRVHSALNDKFPLRWELFARWLELWESTVDGLYVGAKADLAKVQAARIAGSMHRVISGGEPGEYAIPPQSTLEVTPERAKRAGRTTIGSLVDEPGRQE